MTEVTIEYCVPCGHLDRAMTTQREILEHFGREIDGVGLQTGDGGVFVVSVEGETVFDKSAPDAEFDMEAILADIEQVRAETA